MNDEKEDEGYLVLTARLTVRAGLYRDVRELVLAVVDGMDPDATYRAKELCGPEYWDPLTKGEQIKAGECLAYMVRNNELPLEFAGCECASSKEYRRK